MAPDFPTSALSDEAARRDVALAGGEPRYDLDPRRRRERPSSTGCASKTFPSCEEDDVPVAQALDGLGDGDGDRYLRRTHLDFGRHEQTRDASDRSGFGSTTRASSVCVFAEPIGERYERVVSTGVRSVAGVDAHRAGPSRRRPKSRR